MKYRIIIISLILSNLGYGQINTIKDSLNNPIAMTFVEDHIFVVLHGSLPGEGGIATFDINNPETSYQMKIDGLTYPRAIIEKDSLLFIGLRDDIVMVDLRNDNFQMDTIYHEQFLFPRSFAFDNDNLIFAQEEALSKIDLSNSNHEKEILFFFENNPLSLANYGNSILIAEGKSIHQYNLNSNTISEIISGLDYDTYTILIDGNNIYLDQSDLTFGNEEIIVFNLNEIDSGPSSFCNDIGSAIALTKYQGEIYFAEQKAVFNGMPEGKIQVLNKELVNTLFQSIVNKINVFPNPTHDLINIEGDNQYEFVLYNSSGRRVQLNNIVRQLNIKDEPSGIYFLRIFDQFDNSVQTIKIVKE